MPTLVLRRTSNQPIRWKCPRTEVAISSFNALINLEVEIVLPIRLNQMFVDYLFGFANSSNWQPFGGGPFHLRTTLWSFGHVRNA